MIRAATCFVLIAALLSGCDKRSERVVDSAAVLGDTEIQRLTTFHDLLLSDYGIDYRVLTVHSVADINRFAVRRYAELDVGAMSAYGHGLLLVLDADSRQIRLEVGYGLEGYFPDAFVAYVEQRQMLPFFAADRVADGILATTELIVDRAQRYRLGEDGSGEVWLSGSGGAGATTRIETPAPPIPATAPDPPAPAGRSPEQTLARYFAAMERRDGRPDLPLYSPETRRMLQDWVMTPAQMDDVVAAYRKCRPQAPRINASGSLAVIRYDPADRHCAPWFFRRSGDDWLLDLTLMSRAIRFGRDNSWHFDPAVEHPYGFAFEDWQFDRHGFPLGRDRH